MPFDDDVRAGLTAQPKTLPSKYFYDELGSLLFEAITLLPEYYLTRAESQTLGARAGEIIADVQPHRFVELGSGSAVKTRHLIDAGLRRHGVLEYDAIDISSSALAVTTKALQAAYPALTVRGFEGDYYEGLHQLARSKSSSDGRTLALFLGSNIGNFDPPEAQRLLRAIRDVLVARDALLLGTDLKKDTAQLEAAYDDALGVTAAFNLNMLARINRELSGNFDLRSFCHRAAYNEAESRIEMHLESNRDQIISIDGLDLEVSFARGETIHTESAYKFSPEDVSRLAQSSGFTLERSWLDARGQFACNLLRCTST
jgi:dimethylhistidine N-methyltransferase